MTMIPSIDVNSAWQSLRIRFKHNFGHLDPRFEAVLIVALLATIGTVHGICFYSPLNIVAFDYAGTDDYIVWALSKPLVTLGVVAALYGSLAFTGSMGWRLAISFPTAVAVSAATSWFDAERVRAGEGRFWSSLPCTIVEVGAPPSARLNPIGTAGAFVLYYDAAGRSAYAVPEDKIARIECPQSAN